MNVVMALPCWLSPYWHCRPTASWHWQTGSSPLPSTELSSHPKQQLLTLLLGMFRTPKYDR